MIAIFAIGIWAMVINNISNEEFPVKTLEDQQTNKKHVLHLLD